MQLVKLVVELGNHLLDVLRFFLGVEPLDNNFLNIALTITLDDLTVRTKHELSLDLARDRLLREDLINGRIAVDLEQLDEPIINVVGYLWIDQLTRSRFDGSWWRRRRAEGNSRVLGGDVDVVDLV